MDEKHDAFDPQDLGTPEAEWELLLRDAPAWEPPRGPLLVVSPHPDDEVLGAGGLINAHGEAGLPVTIVSVTDGEAAYEWPHLDLLRRRELKDAVQALSRSHIEVRRLGVPDGKVASHLNRLRLAIQELLSPDVTVVAPYARDGHPDHEAVGSVCEQLGREARVPVVSYPIWAWHHRTPSAFGKVEWRRFSLSTCAQRAKARAIDCFASQLRPPQGPPIVPQHVLTYFRRPYEAFLL